MSAGTETPRKRLTSFHSFASVIGCGTEYTDTDWLFDDTYKQEAEKEKKHLVD